MDVDLFGSESESKSESEVEVEVESELGNEIEMRIRISELADPRKKKGKLKCQKSSLYTPNPIHPVYILRVTPFFWCDPIDREHEMKCNAVLCDTDPTQR
ncbi:hypothetical protein EYC84_001288 [Monilinia fructicola]|uniref:Uncharacterized protein n=1 Tax=Monilinia fructicola TaxID=38448 RepID=A0A5M9JLT2_MONFR|nr:hypothetical protein EYC84_001288 [Monilinia fructicola]